MPSVYLETSIISAIVTTRTDHASQYRREVSFEWWNTQAARHQLFISLEVIAELSHHAFRRSAEALELVKEVPIVPIDDEVRGLALILVREKVMPSPVAGDAVHVALACVHGLEYMLSWNVRHLANPNKLQHLQGICLRTGRIPPRIVTPDLLWEDPYERS